ncbi:MAG: hypothetical protein PWR20_563 [Bacteroidales bacterium]|jgi:hypothetical protein|nr:hypothetical protein [Bacteroidales bacterium]MDN5328894.1 hypothetical protein [Bacteroidales bacterium]NLH51636.1 hypothetical protein [Bacteroidales bacterium]NPV35211.1 hypothetical protein [Bacteroidales bacterium]
MSQAKEYNSFIRKLTLFSIALAAVCTVLQLSLPPRMTTPAMPYILLFFVIHTALFHRIAMKMIEKNLSKFNNFYLLSTVARLLLFILVILGYAWLNPSDFKEFTIWFFIFYVVYTFFELSMLLPSIKRPQT